MKPDEPMKQISSPFRIRRKRSGQGSTGYSESWEKSLERKESEGYEMFFKAVIRITLMPILMVFRLFLGTLAFITTISSAIIGLGTSVFVILSMIEFFIGYWQNGIALLALALLVSPIGLPAIANFLLKRVDGACSFVEGLIC